MCVYRWIVLNDDVWGQDLRDYVRSESVKKGQKNMTVESFWKFVNMTIIPEVIKCREGNGLPQSVATNGVSSKTARFVIILVISICTPYLRSPPPFFFIIIIFLI